MAARSTTGCAFRWKCSRRCARPGRRTSRCRCAFPRPTGPRAASPATTRWRSRAPLPRPASTWSMSRPARPCAMPQPVYGRMFQTPFSEQVRNEARVATMCVGNITTADQVNTILAAGRADLVALGRPHLVDPAFTLKAAAWYGAEVCSARRNICRARSRSSATACATGRISRTSKLRLSRRPGPS